ncbi:hypothetical protein N7520_009979 [Penicillium odoratum]|uniref:uncharacterized protein n=1 Tax=Penicillium odoratum TaxID=1167516 RepID=UPI002547F17F|nr:uncharacterized protein N7520_009979 [Penicillium odoratum]KAJ5753062.1 hypothetical protein N7520_009979 [Penicillium odoratum]
MDVVADRNNIRKLLSFVNPTLSRVNLDSFTIPVDMAAQTAIFCRDETATFEVIGSGEFRGFGHEFENSYTISQLKDGAGHHRIISYQLGGLNILIRHETDGYVGDSNPGLKNTSIGDDLTNALKSLSLAPYRASSAPTITVEYSPKAEDVADALKLWEQDHQVDIRKLVALINRILQVTRNWSGSSTIRYDPLKEKLVIIKIKRRKMLPDDLYSRWDKDIPVNVTQKTSAHPESSTVALDQMEEQLQLMSQNLLMF